MSNNPSSKDAFTSSAAQFLGKYASKAFSKAVFYAGDLGDPSNRVGQAIVQTISVLKSIPGVHTATQIVKINDIPETDGEQTYEGFSLHTTDNVQIAPDHYPPNPIICFPGDGGALDTDIRASSGRSTRLLLLNTAAKLILDDIENRSAIENINPVSNEEKEAKRILIKDLKPRIKQDAFSGITLEGLQDLSASTVATVSELLSAQKRTLCYGYMNQDPSEIHKLNLDPNFYGPEAQNFVEKFFLPRIYETNNGYDATASKVSPDQLSRNMRMTLVGNSYGGAFTQQILNALNQALNDAQYAPETINDVLSNIHVHSTHGAEPLQTPLNNSSVSVQEQKDLVLLADQKDLGLYPGPFQRKEHRAESTDSSVIKSSPNGVLIWTDISDFDKIPSEIKDSLADPSTFTPQSIQYHFALGDPLKLPKQAINALLQSIMEPIRIPPIKEALTFDIQTYSPHKAYGKNLHGHPIYIQDVQEALIKDGFLETALNKCKAHEITENELFACIAEEIQVTFAGKKQDQPQISKKQARIASTDIIQQNLSLPSNNDWEFPPIAAQ